MAYNEQYPDDPGISVAGAAWDMFAYSTYRNPFFTSRIGSAGWDPKGSKWRSKLNSILAPGANDLYGHMDNVTRQQGIVGYAVKTKVAHQQARVQANLANKEVESGINRRGSKKEYQKSTRSRGSRTRRKAARNAQDVVAKTKAARRAVAPIGAAAFDSAAASAKALGLSVDAAAALAATGESKGAIASIVRATGESRRNAKGKHIASMRTNEFKGGGWLSKIGIKGSTHAAVAYGAGRLLSGANVVMMAWDVTQLAMKPLHAIADIGANARSTPSVTTGAGIRFNANAAATVRQQAIEQMQTSAYSPRSLLGNEASFLHV